MGRNIARELAASLVVFLVAVPLSMGIALASGAPIMSGLIAAAVGGIVVGILSGAPLQVSGPAAGLAVMVFGFVQQLGMPMLGAVVVAAGVIQVILGSARVARTAMAISPAVIHGMLAGIGVQIALAQLHVVLGGSPQSSAIKNVAALPAQLKDLHGPATMIGLLTIGIVVLWPLIPVKKLKVVPPQLVAVLVATTLAVALALSVKTVTIPADISSAFSLPKVSMEKLGSMAIAAVTLAIVASAESLLSAVATDKMHTGPRANLDKELIAQGTGNVVSGLIGGLPITGVIVRSTANITSGAKTRWSAVMHGVWVVLAVGLLGAYLGKIPLAALAGLLVVVGVKLVNIGHIKELVKHKEGFVYFATLAGVVGINLLAGIGIGIGVALFQLIRKLTKLQVEVKPTADAHEVIIKGALTFVGVPKISKALAELPAGSHVRVDLQLKMMDHAGYEALSAWRSNHEKTGGKVEMDSLHEAWSPNARASSRTSIQNPATAPAE
jgi:carbonic anhydrase